MILKCIYFWFEEEASTSSVSKDQPITTAQKADDVFQKFLETRKIVKERQRQKQLEEGIKHHRYCSPLEAFINSISYLFQRLVWTVKVEVNQKPIKWIHTIF